MVRLRFMLASAAVIALASNLASAAAAGDELASPALTQALEFRRELGLDADLSTVSRADSDSANFPDETWGIPLTVSESAELNRRVQIQLSLDEALAYGRSDPSWAGAWIDQRAGGVPVFAFTARTDDQTSEIARRLPRDTQFRTTTVSRTLAELAELKQRITLDIEELAEFGLQVTSVGFDLMENKVTIGLKHLTTTGREAILAKYGMAVAVRERAPAVADACPQTGCLPLKGGIGMLGKGGAWPGTVGYLARRTDVSPDVLVIVTAGHIVKLGSGATGDPFTHGTTNLGYGINSPAMAGKIHTFFDLADADVGLISVFSSVYPTSRNQILVDEAPVTTRPVLNIQPAASQLPNSLVCRMGRTTLLQCGTIRDNDETMISDVSGVESHLIEHTVVYRRDALGGDSGGPIFVTVTPPGEPPEAVLYGTHVHSEGGAFSSTKEGWYSPIDRGIAQLQSRHEPLALSPCVTGSCGLP